MFILLNTSFVFVCYLVLFIILGNVNKWSEGFHYKPEQWYKFCLTLLTIMCSCFLSVTNFGHFLLFGQHKENVVIGVLGFAIPLIIFITTLSIMFVLDRRLSKKIKNEKQMFLNKKNEFSEWIYSYEFITEDKFNKEKFFPYFSKGEVVGRAVIKNITLIEEEKLRYEQPDYLKCIYIDTLQREE